MSKFRKKPVVIEAQRFEPGFGHSFNMKLAAWCGGSLDTAGYPPLIRIPTLEGTMTAMSGDWIIKEVKKVRGNLVRFAQDPSGSGVSTWYAAPVVGGVVWAEIFTDGFESGGVTRWN